MEKGEGVGDVEGSYACDGLRMLKWNIASERYGKLWDVGDVIGVCIDFESKAIEFYFNGEKQGIAFENIPIGANAAYFPSISMHNKQSALFNFGSDKLTYNYEGYEPFDIPASIYKNSYKVTEEILEIVDNFIIKILLSQDISFDSKIELSSKAFNFLANIAFKDSFIFNNLLIKFLVKLMKDLPKSIVKLLEFLVIFSLKPEKFVNKLLKSKFPIFFIS